MPDGSELIRDLWAPAVANSCSIVGYEPLLCRSNLVSKEVRHAMDNGERTYEFKALTDLWTGSVVLTMKKGVLQETSVPDRLVTTGLLGSIRWWLEVVVRGLGGSACDPSNTTCNGRTHCVACELFGCTGWARKFVFEVLDESEKADAKPTGNDKTKQTKDKAKDKFGMRQIKRGQTFRLHFKPLRPIRVEEWTLLDASLRLIAKYGAIGGKTVFKPTDEQPDFEMKSCHRDYGLVEMTTASQFSRTGRGDLQAYLSSWPELKHGNFAWASLQHFWCVHEMHLGRQSATKSTFNQVLGRKEPKAQGQGLASDDAISKWLAGSRPNPSENKEAESKKVFSFKRPERTFGFVKPGVIDFDSIKKRLTKAWDENGWHLITGDSIIDQLLCAGQEDRS